MVTLTDICAVGGLVFGATGMVLGIINLWRAIDRDKVHIFVSAKIGGRPPNQKFIGLVVRNLSYIPVTIEEVGFTQKYSKVRFCTADTSVGQLPQMMKPRTCISAEIPIDDHDRAKFMDVNRVFVTTSCGLTFTADASFVRRYIKSQLGSPK